MKINANAKINLTLDVVSKRDDGYHEINTIMQEISLCDIIDVTLSDKSELVCEKLSWCKSENNIAYKAAKLFFEKSGLKGGFSIHINKHIPVCAGLGGGSSDAAAVLKALNVLNNNFFSDEELCTMALSLGADVPFFIKGGTCLAKGVGEVISPLEQPEKKWLCIIKPNINVSTAMAYSEIDKSPCVHPDVEGALRALASGNTRLMYKYCGNSFENVVKKMHSEIGIIKKHLYNMGALFSMMSGSGSSVFGIFDSEDDAERAYKSFNEFAIEGGVCRFI